MINQIGIQSAISLGLFIFVGVANAETFNLGTAGVNSADSTNQEVNSLFFCDEYNFVDGAGNNCWEEKCNGPSTMRRICRFPKDPSNPNKGPTSDSNCPSYIRTTNYKLVDTYKPMCDEDGKQVAFQIKVFNLDREY